MKNLVDFISPNINIILNETLYQIVNLFYNNNVILTCIINTIYHRINLNRTNLRLIIIFFVIYKVKLMQYKRCIKK